MPDQKPPRVDGSERETLMALLRYQRDSLLRKLAGISEDDSRLALVGTGTTLAWLVRHMTRAETQWMVVRFAGHEPVPAGDTVPPGGIVLPDDAVQPSDTVASLSAGYRAAWAMTDAIVADSDLDEPCRGNPGDTPVRLRWVLMHLLEETARHAGHADILRELIDGSTGR
jgi:uncharacterized damage-inducible protein DinB